MADVQECHREGFLIRSAFGWAQKRLAICTTPAIQSCSASSLVAEQRGHRPCTLARITRPCASVWILWKHADWWQTKPAGTCEVWVQFALQRRKWRVEHDCWPWITALKITATRHWPDVLLWSTLIRTIIMAKLTFEAVFEKRKAKYADLTPEWLQPDWRVNVYLVGGLRRHRSIDLATSEASSGHGIHSESWKKGPGLRKTGTVGCRQTHQWLACAPACQLCTYRILRHTYIFSHSNTQKHLKKILG